MSNSQPILFYSTRCSHSKQIIDTLRMLKKEALCRMIAIDGLTRDKLPPFLKSVPTLFNPETKDIYIGKDIYAYISKPVQPRREVPTQQPPPSASAMAANVRPPGVGGVPTPPGAPGVSVPNKDFEAWSFGTASGFSDNYSSWDSPGNFSASDQLHYTFIGDTRATPVAPEPETKQSYEGAKEGRNADLASRMEAMQKQRDSEFGGVERK
jgi:hypothetical protein